MRLFKFNVPILLPLLLLMADPIESVPVSNLHAESPGFDRPAGKNQSRSVAVARNGMVATSHPAAVQVAVDVLRNGGNAADAAIAANAMLGVVEPMSCGIGGDLFAIYWDSKTKKLYGLNASGRSPQSLTRNILDNEERIPLFGPLSWSTPGCVDGWHTLSQRFGTKPLADLLDPSIALAEAGFPVTEVIASYWKSGEKALREHEHSKTTYLIDGNAPQAGDIFRNPHLGATYRRIAQHGAKDFYHGEIAQKLDMFSKEAGGYLRSEDLKAHRSDWIEPVSTNYRGFDVWELPPNGQGIAALQILNLIEPYDIRAMGPGSADWLHLFTEAKKLAFADRARFYADPEMAEVPTATLISKDYADRRRKLIDMTQAADDVPAGDPRLKHGDTVYITVVDKDRNCCSLIQSLYHGFGSKMVAGDLGFAIQNRGALFTLEEGHANEYAPGKRPFHTIIPAMVTRDDRPWLCFGVMGGDMQPQGHVQVLVNMIDFQMNVQAAGDAARIRHLGSATPTGVPAQGGGTLTVESGVKRNTINELRERGHNVMRGSGGFGGYQAIRIDWDRGVLHGATEARKDGIALGW